VGVGLAALRLGRFFFVGIVRAVFAPSFAS
jgi:hypothetical protein